VCAVKLREDLRRDGLAMHFLLSEKEMRVLAAAVPDAVINVGYPGICAEELATCQRIVRGLAAQSVESAVVGHACPAHVAALEAAASIAENTSVNVWVPCSRGLARRIAPSQPETFLASCVAVVRQWTSAHTTPIDVALVDATAAEEGICERAIGLAERFSEVGCRHVIIGDTMGTATPSRLLPLFDGLAGRGVPFEFHGHDDGGRLVDNIQVAVDSGAVGIGCAAFGLGERGTLADTRFVAGLLSLPCNCSAYADFAELHRAYRDTHRGCEGLLDPATITTGAQLRLRRGVPGTRLLFGVTSDRQVLGEMLGVRPDLLDPELLRELKDTMYREKRCALSPADVLAFLDDRQKPWCAWRQRIQEPHGKWKEDA